MGRFFGLFNGSPSMATISPGRTYAADTINLSFIVTLACSISLSASRLEQKPEELINLFNAICSLSMVQKYGYVAFYGRGFIALLIDLATSQTKTEVLTATAVHTGQPGTDGNVSPCDATIFEVII